MRSACWRSMIREPSWKRIHLMGDIFQWQRLMVEGVFDANILSRAILYRLAAVAGLPSSSALQEHLTRSRKMVSEIWRNLVG